ncbi:MAG TPA: ABC transporter ATP-binding protein [Candidatus Latescibacteria bacterium]|nr:ABC transporter ATP-binding protein [Candidatus Latescibacterota bacterium]
MLRKALPPKYAAWLSEQNIPESDILLCTDNDITFEGEYAERWVVVTRDAVIMLRERDGQVQAARSFKMADIESARIDPRVGSGFLQVKVHGHWAEVARFSNARAIWFERIAAKITRFKETGEIILTEEDEKEQNRCPTCGLLLRSSTDICPRCINKNRVFGRLLRMMQPYWPWALGTLLLVFTGIGLDLVPPQLSRILMDDIFVHDPARPYLMPEWALRLMNITPGTQMTPSEKVTLLFFVVFLGMAGVQLLRIGLNIVIGRLSVTVGTKITYDLRHKLFSRLSELSVRYYDRHQVGILMQRVTGDTESLHGFVSQSTQGFLVNILLPVFIGAALFKMNPTLTLYVFIPAPFVIISTYYFWEFVYPNYYKYWDSHSKMNAMLNSVLSGVRVVKAFAQEEREISRFNHLSGNVQASRQRVDKATGTFYPIVGFIFGLGGLIVWYVGGRYVLEGKGMTLGTLTAFTSYLGMFYGPLSSLTYISSWLTGFMTSAQRVFEVLDTEPELQDTDSALHLHICRGEIEFKNVTFGYDRYNPVIRDVTAHIKPGEMIGIVGRSGSGKTTFVNLLCRFYEVDQGEILIDGISLRELHKDDIRRNIGLVLQEPFLFRGTIRENIAYGRPDADIENVMKAAKAANAHDFIMRLADGYDTKLGEYGSGLSGGERQRISIARALLYDPAILILDEATSSVDTESEKQIQEALAVATKGRTTIAIAHRLSTLRNSNRIIVMDDGRIIEMGTHDELIKKEGTYYRLVKIQTQLTSEPTVDRLELEKKEQEAAVSDESSEKETEKENEKDSEEKTDAESTEPSEDESSKDSEQTS